MRARRRNAEGHGTRRMNDRNYETLALEQPAEHLLVVRFNRPEVRNAISTQVGRDMLDVFSGLANPARPVSPSFPRAPARTTWLPSPALVSAPLQVTVAPSDSGPVGNSSMLVHYALLFHPPLFEAGAGGIHIVRD